MSMPNTPSAGDAVIGTWMIWPGVPVTPSGRLSTIVAGGGSA
jgi:hypothetical protein